MLAEGFGNSRGPHADTASSFERPHSRGAVSSCYSALELFIGEFRNLVPLQIPLGDRIILSAGNQTYSWNGFGIY